MVALKIDKEKALEMFKQGATNPEVAAKFHCSRQAAELCRRKLVTEGKLQKGRPGRRVEGKVPEFPSNVVNLPSLNDIEEFLIAALSDAREAKQLRNVVAALKNDNAIIKAELDRLQRYYKDRQEKEMRFKVAVQQGEIDSSYLTEHILGNHSTISLDTQVPHNIIPKTYDYTPIFMLSLS